MLRGWLPSVNAGMRGNHLMVARRSLVLCGFYVAMAYVRIGQIDGDSPLYGEVAGRMIRGATASCAARHNLHVPRS